MKIRRAKPDDEKEIKELITNVLNEIYGPSKIDWEDFAKYLSFFVAEDDGKIIGTAALKKIDNDWIKLKRMYIHPDFQGVGVGTTLLDECLRFSRDGNFKRMVLTTYPEMVGAVKFYKKNGFNIVDNPDDRFFTNPTLRNYCKRQFAMEKKL